MFFCSLFDNYNREFIYFGVVSTLLFKMKIPRNISGMDFIKVLVKHYDWEVYRRQGSHATLKKKSEAEILTVPLHSHLDVGTFLAILRKAKIEKENFLKKL